ncbi:unnamed protein product [Rotaria sordida]|uniref:Pheromone-processing carboxypeptidase KEX1 n=2 Tax=Rotaria sordida TaxID=392033 RepID=A0A813S9E9_9BILA|nr:unnamed protein product [Rotaria sordida]
MIVQLLIFLVVINSSVNGLQANDFYVRDLPLLPKEASSIRMHAGHLPVNPQHHGALFFWHFASKHIGDKSRTVIWLNGGPGCSSLIGAWAEIGPFRFQDENTIVENNGSWHMFANLLFIDQPVGTGFSYIDTDSFIHELNQMSNQFLSFLDRYIEIFPELLQDDIYLAGESFAGQHIPYIAQEILTKRSVLKLRGLLIGNGWIDPVTTYESYLPFAVANNLVENNSVLYSNIANQVKVCQQALSNEVHVIDEACELILNQIKVYGAMNNHYTTKEKDRCVNVYDVRLDDTWPDCGMNWPSDIKYVTLYLHRQDVKSRIHVSSKKSGWTECADSVFQTFRAYHSIPSIKLLPDLLRQIPIVLYSEAELEIWAGPLSDGSQAVLLFNRVDSGSEPITVKWSDIGFPINQSDVVRDLWARKDLGTFTGSYTSPNIDHHAVMMLKITLTNRQINGREKCQQLGS